MTARVETAIRQDSATPSEPASALLSSAQTVRATVSIVSHGQGSLVCQLVADLDKHAFESVERVIVTCNVPERDDMDSLRARFPVELVRNVRPQGYGANHNAAFRRCTSPWFLVLNPDLRLDCDPIAPLAASAAARIGVVAPRVIEPGQTKPEPFRSLPTPREILGRLLLRRHPAPSRPEWVAGMFMLFRREAFATLNGFDEGYFMYVEDVDICARLRLSGWDVTVNEQVCVHHEAQRASRRQWRPLIWHLRSLLRWWSSNVFWRSLQARD